MRTITRVRAVKVTGGERLIATFEDGTEGVLVQKTTRPDFAICAVHSGETKSGATAACPEASFVSFHGAGAKVKPARFARDTDTITKILTVEREGAE